MPHKDPEKRRAYMREWYARPENRKRVIAKVAARKHTDYAGTCVNCGGPTVGESKQRIPDYCSKPACASAQRKEDYWSGETQEYQRIRRAYQYGHITLREAHASVRRLARAPVRKLRPPIQREPRGHDPAVGESVSVRGAPSGAA